jgi:hypothetical protein
VMIRLYAQLLTGGELILGSALRNIRENRPPKG